MLVERVAINYKAEECVVACRGLLDILQGMVKAGGQANDAGGVSTRCIHGQLAWLE